MKFELLMIVCSALAGECSQPTKQVPLFTTHYECASVGYLRALKILDSMGADLVNNNKIVISFTCNDIIAS
jgi:hypothetical protein|tara:strand:- start:317 stop:529 length:213 start_codon:yes stop_codon:yes gene_type:complete